MNWPGEKPSRHLLLLILLLMIFILSPFIVPYCYGPTILNVIAAAVLLSATYAVSARKSFLIFALSLSGVSTVLTFWLAAAPSHWLVVTSHGTLVILISFFAIAILGYVLRSGKVTADKIYGAVCAYLLFGYAWAFVYSLLEEVQPGSFTSVTSMPANDIVGRVMQMRYFSFVTLSTVGYGDIVPHTPAARTMALLEAMLGQFYLVALIGRLVGLHIVHGNSDRRGD
ncbi:MAG TPA: ion channel [Chthoniobacterales bacterium]|nr:ion channel [Chthoniobacterales bacterium]